MTTTIKSSEPRWRKTTMKNTDDATASEGSMGCCWVGPYRLELTCGACPEQYDVYDGEKQVGYLRLRHGYFRADVPDCGGTTVYEAEDMQGDGNFTDDERDKHLRAACDAIQAHWANNDLSREGGK